MRKRSSTVSCTPIGFGQHKVTPCWIHDQNFHPGEIIINTSIWPGLARGDLIQVTPAGEALHPGTHFLFFVDESTTNNSKIQVSHVSISREVSQKFGFAQNKNVTLTKIDPATAYANALEIYFRDIYICRREMSSINRFLEGKTIYAGQKIHFYLASGAIIKDIYINGNPCSAAVVTPKTRTIFRSLTARCSIFISVCRELWEFCPDGERYYEKIVHSFFPALITKWREYSSKHLTSIVLFSRVFYEKGELEYAAGPLKQDDEGRWYKDFYKVVLDLEVVRDWKPVLVDLKESFFAFQRDILFNHHYHQHQRKNLRTSGSPSNNFHESPASCSPQHSSSFLKDGAPTQLRISMEPSDHRRLVGSLSYAHSSPLLEAINLSWMSPSSSQGDRSLALTGHSTIIITPPSSSAAPSACSFRVNRNLLKFTTERLVDIGLAVDLVSLGKKPLGRAPIFGWKAKEGEGGLGFGKGMDAVGGLMGGIGPSIHAGLGTDQMSTLSPPIIGKASEGKDTGVRMYFWEPFWMTVSFWDTQADQPFRTDRFTPLARMPEIQSLGLLDHGVSNAINISIEYTPDPASQCDIGLKDTPYSGAQQSIHEPSARRAVRDQFDKDVFAKRAPADTSSMPFSVPPGGPPKSHATPDRTSKGSDTACSPRLSIEHSSVANPTRLEKPFLGHVICDVQDSGSNSLPNEHYIPRVDSSPQLLSPSQSSKSLMGESRCIGEAPIKGEPLQTVNIDADPLSLPDAMIRDASSPEPRNGTDEAPATATLSSRGSRNMSRSRSRDSARSVLSTTSHTSSVPSRRRPPSAKMTPSRFSSSPGSWLFIPFRSGISVPQASTVSANKDRTTSLLPAFLDRNMTQDSSSPRAIESKGSDSHNTMSLAALSLTSMRNASAAVGSDIPPSPQVGHPSVPTPNLPSTRNITYTTPRSSRGSESTSSSVTLSTPASSHTVTGNLGARRPSISNRRSNSHTRTLSSIVRENESQVLGGGVVRRGIRPNPTLSAINASWLSASLLPSQKMMARRWQHVFPAPSFTSDVKWKSMCAPACLPITTEYHPSESDVNQNFIQHTYDVFLAREASGSILLRRDSSRPGSEWPLQVMRTMVHARMVQGFQLIVGGPNIRQKYIPEVEETMLMPASLPLGISDSLINLNEAVFISMGDHVHRITYEAEEDLIRVRRIIRKTTEPTIKSVEYDCLVWPKLGEGYTEARAIFSAPELDTYGWNRLDLTITGYQREFSDIVRHCQSRYLVIPSEHPPSDIYVESGERLSEEECQLLGTDRLAELFGKARWLAYDETLDQFTPPRFLYTWLDPPASVLDTSLMESLDDLNATAAIGKPRHVNKSLEGISLGAIAKAMREEKGLIRDRHWNRKFYPDSFTGHEFVAWVLKTFFDFSTREQATEWGDSLMEKGLFHHVRDEHRFMDGHYFYVFGPTYAPASTSSPSRWLFTLKRPSLEGNDATSAPMTGPQKLSRKQHALSQTMVIDADHSRRSPFAESVVLHHDVIQNPGTAFHFELHWVATSARCIEDLLQHWSWVIARYGLRLVEGYVDPIVDIGSKNIFQSCFPIALALAPPSATSLDLHMRFVEGTSLTWFFEYAILRKFGYILDIESASSYSDTVDFWYSYRRASFKHSQFIHSTGLAFAQVMGEEAGFQWITNRLLATSSSAHSWKNTTHSQGDKTPHERANMLRLELLTFCSNAQALRIFYDDVISKLPPKGHVVETMSQPTILPMLSDVIFPTEYTGKKLDSPNPP